MQYGARVRWEELFTALEDDARGMERGQRDADIADRTRSARADVSWLMRCAHANLTIRVQGAGVVRGVVLRVTPAWLLLRDHRASDDTIVAVRAVTAVSGMASTAVDDGGIDRRLGWTHAWRVLSRDRSEVRTTCVDASIVRGVPEMVGSDYVQLREYDAGRPSGAAPIAVPYAAIATVNGPR